MTVTLVGSFSGAPGATTLAVALAASLPGGVVVDGDWPGGRLAARLGVPREPGILSLAAHRSGGSLDDFVQRLPDGRALVAGPESAEVAEATWRSGGSGLATQLSEWPGEIVVDAGRLSPSSPVFHHLAPVAARVLAVVANDAAELAVAASAVGRVRSATSYLVLALAGERPYSSAHVASALGCAVIGVIPRDAAAAAAAGSVGLHRNLRATRWARSVRSIAETLVSIAETESVAATRSWSGASI